MRRSRASRRCRQHVLVSEQARLQTIINLIMMSNRSWGRCGEGPRWESWPQIICGQSTPASVMITLAGVVNEAPLKADSLGDDGVDAHVLVDNLGDAKVDAGAHHA